MDVHYRDGKQWERYLSLCRTEQANLYEIISGRPGFSPVSQLSGNKKSWMLKCLESIAFLINSAKSNETFGVEKQTNSLQSKTLEQEIKQQSLFRGKGKLNQKGKLICHHNTASPTPFESTNFLLFSENSV